MGVKGAKKTGVFDTPKPQRQDPSLFAPDPQLRGPSSQFLQWFLQDPTKALSGLIPQQTSALQQQTSDAWSNFLAQGNPGQGVLDAATPVFQRNLQLGADTLRQAGPRFASNTERLVANQGQQAMQDFNLFGQQVLQEGVNQQIAGLTGAGNFANTGQQNIMSFLGPLFQQMFGSAFQAGGLTQPGTVTQAQPWWQQVLNVGSQVAGIATGRGGPKSATPTPVGVTSWNGA